MISEKQAADSLLTSLRLAEIYQRWDLLASVVRYAKDAGARLGQVDGVWWMELPTKRQEP